jgi:transcriptional regulator with XRE-family HTH domain
MAQIVSVQCFLARTVLGWSARKLAKVAGVSAHTVANFERGPELKASTIEVIQRRHHLHRRERRRTGRAAAEAAPSSSGKAVGD